MCCRYYYDQLKVNKILEELRVRQPHSGRQPMGFAMGDSLATEFAASGSQASGVINPGSEALMLTGVQDQIEPVTATWGFPGKGGQLVINARSESALQKPMFSKAFEARRCLLPAQCFYEWDAEKNKVTFSSLDAPVIYLAGLWSLYDDLIRFVVLTTAANATMLPVHDRMPLMVAPCDLRQWLFDTVFAVAYLKKQMPLLKAEREYEQLSLF